MNDLSIFSEQEEEGWVEKYIISNMPTFLLVFANIGVIVSDYRAIDVLTMTLNSPWKAWLAVIFSCAIPFLMWEMAWQYKHTTDKWRGASLAMAGVSFATSVFYGVADYVNLSDVYANSDLLAVSAVILTGVHIVMALLYFYNDPQRAMKRRTAQMIARADNANSAALLANSLLANAQIVAQNRQVLEDTFGKKEADEILALLAGKKPAKKPEKVNP